MAIVGLLSFEIVLLWRRGVAAQCTPQKYKNGQIRPGQSPKSRRFPVVREMQTADLRKIGLRTAWRRSQQLLDRRIR